MRLLVPMEAKFSKWVMQVSDGEGGNPHCLGTATVVAMVAATGKLSILNDLFVDSRTPRLTTAQANINIQAAPVQQFVSNTHQ